jgi:hypothetical protein
MKLAVVGGRDFDDYQLFCWHLFGLHLPITTIISGGARGADSFAKSFALNLKFEYIEFPADWGKYGKRAGYLRNVQIVDECDLLIAFWDGESKGTKHSIDLAEKAGKLYKIVRY